MAFQPQPLRFQRNGASARERVMEGRQLVRVEQLGGLGVLPVEFAGFLPALADLRPRPFQHVLVVGVLPLHQVADDVEQALALARGLLLVHPAGEALAGLVARVVDQLREQHSPRRRQRPPRPPQMQRAGMAMPDRLLARRGGVDVVQREGDFDEFLGGLDGMHLSQVQEAGRARTNPSGLVMVSGSWLARSLSSPMTRWPLATRFNSAE